ncbi:hypothetical protein A9264_05440 [Vibrio sp. UCD-FRSSP16_10]|uniref:oligogalacturonate-specific porin KdgM family protein n=1 Tax=unclassified Vibrio TaxID=2614977 RepID=UPI000801B93F|nr:MULTISPECIES: oligogalacturonate-specific porin KdgM family protein [unclassified Vibrio]OBT07914.1 hypothetical protein A9260_07680 [Vibrio sp. UCD-FRSSP16_30]OBT17089.1 hypothetical protein A9264_05440 [Vibrio sp. UCD-FRSSP16_10]
MNKSKIALAVVATVFAGSVSAGAIDYRAEYKHKDEDFAHRIKIGSSVGIADKTKLYFSVEQKFQSNAKDDGTQPFWYQMERGDSEFDWGIRYAINKKWYVQPGMPITFGDERTTYKPQFRVGYKADFGLTTALRYRHEFREHTDSSSSTLKSTNGETYDMAGKTHQKGKLTLTGSYKFAQPSLKNLQLSYEANYVKSYDNEILANSEDWEWDLGVQIGYKFDNLRPYVQFWTVDHGSTSGDRQLRTRVGLNYKF